MNQAHRESLPAARFPGLCSSLEIFSHQPSCFGNWYCKLKQEKIKPLWLNNLASALFLVYTQKALKCVRIIAEGFEASTSYLQQEGHPPGCKAASAAFGMTAPASSLTSFQKWCCRGESSVWRAVWSLAVQVSLLCQMIRFNFQNRGLLLLFTIYYKHFTIYTTNDKLTITNN